MCSSISKMFGFADSSKRRLQAPPPTVLPPMMKAPPPPPKTPPPARLLEEPTDKPKVDFAKMKSGTSKSKRVGASDLRIPLNQQQSNAGSGGLNV